MKNKVYNRKTKEDAKKDRENCRNRNKSNSKMPFTSLKFVNFAPTIDQVIQQSLKLQ